MIAPSHEGARIETEKLTHQEIKTGIAPSHEGARIETLLQWMI
ncbi:MAG: hypothetical protein RL346_1994 [Verrucomicrobiota bacterium]